MNWRGDQREVSRDSGGSRLTKTRDRIQSVSGSYASSHQLSVKGCKDVVIREDVGLQVKNSYRETVTHGGGKDCGQKSAATIVCAPSSSGHYHHCGSTEKGKFQNPWWISLLTDD